MANKLVMCASFGRCVAGTPLALLLFTMIACSSTKHAPPRVHDHSLNPNFCQILYGYQVSPTGEFEFFEIIKEVDCAGKRAAMEFTDDYKEKECRHFWATHPHTPTYRKNENPTVVIRLLALIRPEEVASFQTKIHADALSDVRAAPGACLRMLDREKKPDKSIERTR